MKLSFSWIGLVVFLLPMLINVVYALCPPADAPKSPAPVTRWVEWIEKISRVAYLLALVLPVRKRPLDWGSEQLCLALTFLALYYAVWLRYFAQGRRVEWLEKPLGFVPMPLAVFPVLYYLCAAIWLGNFPAAGLMCVFGAAHLTVSFQSFQ